VEPTTIKKCMRDLNKVDNKRMQTIKFYYG